MSVCLVRDVFEPNLWLISAYKTDNSTKIVSTGILIEAFDCEFENVFNIRKNFTNSTFFHPGDELRWNFSFTQIAIREKYDLFFVFVKIA
jgi:hypothetical protein